MKILIPNASSPKNIGDLSMLVVLTKLIKTSIPKSQIVIHSYDHRLHSHKDFGILRYSLHSWAVFINKSVIQRMYRLFLLFLLYVIYKLYKPAFQSLKGVGLLIKDYKNAQMIVFAPGGYFRTKKGLRQSLNLFMQLVPFIFSKLFYAKKIVAPISFGPFAFKWQEKLSAKILSGMDLVSVRERISYEKLKRYNTKNLILASDLALLSDDMSRAVIKDKKFIIGFTIRNWLSKKEQHDFEEEVISAIHKFATETGALVQPIVHVDAPEYGDDDLDRTQKIVNALRMRGIKTANIRVNTNLSQTFSNLKILDMMLGMRMHSNILAAVLGIPFVAIAYEPKTTGVAESLGMKRYCLDCREVNSISLYKLLLKAHKSRRILRRQIQNKLKFIKNTQGQLWNDLFQKYLIQN